VTKRRHNYLKLSSVDAARTEHAARRDRALSAAQFRRTLKGLPAGARRAAVKAHRAALKDARKAARSDMKVFESELKSLRRASRPARSKGERTRIRIGKGKRKSKAKGKKKSVAAQLKAFFRSAWGGWSKAGKGSKGFAAGFKAGKKKRKKRKKHGKKHNPSLRMIPGYELIMSGPAGEALSYVPGAAVGVASAVVIPRFFPSWNVGWKGLLLKFGVTVGVSLGVARVASRKHGVAVAIGGLLATVIEAVNMFLTPGSQVRSAFDLSGLADATEVADDGSVILESDDQIEDVSTSINEEHLLTGNSGYSDELDSMSESIDPVAELADVLGY